MKKKIITITLAAMLVLSSFVGAFAAEVGTAGSTGTTPVTLTVEEGATFSVTVPTSLPITVNAAGAVTTATSGKIINNSHGAVQVTNVDLNAADGWTIIPFDSDLSTVKVGTKNIGLKINNIESVAGALGAFNAAGFPVIAAKNDTTSDELAIAYDAIVPAQAAALTDEKVLDVVFTIGWYAE